jgi:hypothetical protein
LPQYGNYFQSFACGKTPHRGQAVDPAASSAGNRTLFLAGTGYALRRDAQRLCETLHTAGGAARARDWRGAERSRRNAPGRTPQSPVSGVAGNAPETLSLPSPAGETASRSRHTAPVTPSPPKGDTAVRSLYAAPASPPRQVARRGNSFAFPSRRPRNALSRYRTLVTADTGP